MVTVTGTFLRPDDTPCTGAVTFAVYVAASDTTPADRVVTPAPVVVRLDDTGSFTVDLVASDDDGWQTDGPMPYTIGINVTGQRAYNYAAYINDPGPWDIGELVVLDWPPNVANIPTDGPQGPQGEAALIVGSFTRDPAELPPDGFLPADWDSPGKPANDLQCLLGYAIIHYPSGHLWSFVGPEKYAPGWVDSGKVTGPQGDQGDQGDAATVDAGTTTTGDAGTDAAVVNSGTTSAAVFDFTIPKGDQGDKGDQGEVSQAELEAYAAARATVGNLLTDNQASGGDTLGTTEGFGNLGTLSMQRSTGWGADGSSGSILFTATGTGNMSGGVSNTALAPVAPGRSYTAVLTVRAAVIAGADIRCAAQLRFRNAGGSLIGSDVGAYSYLTLDGDTVLTVSGVAPADAVGVHPILAFSGAQVVGDAVYADNWGTWQGAGGNWAMPGTPITGLGTRITRPNIDDRLVEQWNGSAWSVVDYDSGLRDVSADLLNGWDIAAPDATEHCYMRRVNSEVRLYWYSFTMGETAVNTTIYDIPDGFNASTYYKDLRAFAVGISNSNYLIMQINPGRINVRAATGLVLNWELCWAVDVSIPTSLPGVLVTQAPQ